MGKRRNRGLHFHNFDRPTSKWRGEGYWEQHPPRKRKDIFRWLLENVAGQNSGKYLNDMSARGEYFWFERDRVQDQSYYTVRLRGNYLLVHQTQFIVNGAGVNTFLGSLVGFEKPPVAVTKLILRHPLHDYKTFINAYAEAAPNLEVWLN